MHVGWQLRSAPKSTTAQAMPAELPCLDSSTPLPCSILMLPATLYTLVLSYSVLFCPVLFYLYVMQRELAGNWLLFHHASD